MFEPEPSPRSEQSSPSSRSERRVFVRIARDLTVTCRPARRHDVAWPGRTHDVSRGGIALLLRHCFQPGSRLTVELRRGDGSLLREVEVRVVHARAVLADGNHSWLLGCQFDEPLGEEDLRALL
jgi:hypothetical protein